MQKNAFAKRATDGLGKWVGGLVQKCQKGEQWMQDWQERAHNLGKRELLGMEQ